MEKEKEVNELLGSENVNKVINDIKAGKISRMQIKQLSLKMHSMHQNQNVHGDFMHHTQNTADIKNHDLFRLLLDSWYTNELFNLDSSECQKKFHEILDEIRNDSSKKLCEYKEKIRKGHNDKIEERLSKLKYQNNEIFISRRFKDTENGTTCDIEKLFTNETNNIVMIVGEAGAGKSSIASKIVKEWAEGDRNEDKECCLFLSASNSNITLPLNKLIWDGVGTSGWGEDTVQQVFEQLGGLARNNKIIIVLDGIDEIGSITKQDIDDAGRIAEDPAGRLSLKTLCAGILNEKIIPGARVIATGRTELKVPGINTKHFVIEDLNDTDRNVLVKKVEQNPSEIERIEKALEKLSDSQKDQFLKHPMTTRMIISLIKEEENFDMSKISNSTEVYLLSIIKNLNHQNSDTKPFTELTKENKVQLQNCFKICLHKIQTMNSASAIEGWQIVDNKDETCFQTHLLDKNNSDSSHIN